MKTLIKLLLSAAVIYACVQGARAAWTYYQFKDAAQQTLIFGGGSSIGELQQRILIRAAELEVPIQPQELQINRDGPRTVAEAAYTQPVELLPSYTYPIRFRFRVDALAVRPATASDALPK